jgi:antitoxin (DNA-binding transcriptional repressor) of toxin-antitoxin stability system
MHEAKTRLSELVRAVEEKNETVLICRKGKPVARLTTPTRRSVNRLKTFSDLKPIAINYDPTEPLSQDEWPPEYR